ncbi:MAG: Dabb family protein [Pyrinomonadaceae bacterium]
MLIHIVCWKYKPEITEEERTSHRVGLAALAFSIPNEGFEVGADVLHLERSFETGLVARFVDRDGLDTYTDHPEHKEVAALGKQIASQVVSVDFIIDD